MKKVLLFAGQAGILWAIYWLGNQIATAMAIPIPGNVLGMVLLFVLLSCGIIKPQQLQIAVGFLLKHLPFFFIPIAVGLMNWGELFFRNSVILSLAVVVSMAATFFAVGFSAQMLQRGKKTWNN